MLRPREGEGRPDKSGKRRVERIVLDFGEQNQTNIGRERRVCILETCRSPCRKDRCKSDNRRPKLGLPSKAVRCLPKVVRLNPRHVGALPRETPVEDAAGVYGGPQRHFQKFVPFELAGTLGRTLLTEFEIDQRTVRRRSHFENIAGIMSK